MNCLAYILDTVRTNALTILRNNGITFISHEFTYQLARGLCLPSVQRRFDHWCALRVNQLQKIKRVLYIEDVHPQPNNQNHQETSGQCYVCFEQIVGTANYKMIRERLNNKLKTRCNECNKFLCKKSFSLSRMLHLHYEIDTSPVKKYYNTLYHILLYSCIH